MRVVNPSGRVPSSKEDLKAYACICSKERGDWASVLGTPTPTCEACQFSCDSNQVNRNANQDLARTTNYVNA